MQAAGDRKPDLIVAQAVVQSSRDRQQLSGLALVAQEELPGPNLQVVADKGYHQADPLEACEAAGIETFVPEQGTPSGRGKEARVYPKEKFRYDAPTDSSICPTGQPLRCQAQSQAGGVERWLYYNRRACRACAHKPPCTAAAYREIARRINEAVVKRAAARVALHPEKVRQRKPIVEHVFGTLRTWGYNVFLLRGLAKVRHGIKFQLPAEEGHARVQVGADVFVLGVDGFLSPANIDRIEVGLDRPFMEPPGLVNRYLHPGVAGKRVTGWSTILCTSLMAASFSACTALIWSSALVDVCDNDSEMAGRD